MQETLNKIYGYIIQYGLNVLAAIIILIIGKWVAGIISRIAESLMLRAKVK